jgi:hypothetical protein
MRIQFERSGGLAGMRLAVTVDSAALPPDEARDLQQMVQAARLLELPPVLTAAKAGADQFCYRLAVEDGGGQHAVEACEAAVPEGLRPLIRYLTTKARVSRMSARAVG